MEKLNEHLREGRDGFAELAKSAVVSALRQAANDFEGLAAAADKFSDDLLGLDVEEALLTSIQLKQEAAALERRTLDDIKAEIMALTQRRNRRPTKRFD